MSLDIVIRISNFHVIIDLIFGYLFIYTVELENKGIESTLFWIITALPILLYTSSIFIAFMLSHIEHKFNTIFDVIFPPFVGLMAFLLGDFQKYIKRMKINDISKTNSIYIAWLINSICEFFISIPKTYILFICENNLKEKPEIYLPNKFLIQTTKYLAIIGAIKGVLTLFLAFYSFFKFIFDDNYNLNEKTNKKKSQNTNEKKKQ